MVDYDTILARIEQYYPNEVRCLPLSFAHQLALT